MIMKQLLISVLVLCMAATGCQKNDAQQDAPYIQVKLNYLTVMPQMVTGLKVSSNVDWAIEMDDWSIADVVSYEKNDDGTETILIQAYKLGRTKLRLAEAGTKRYETVIDIECIRIGGKWREEKPLYSQTKYAVQVVAEPAIKEQIEKELLAEASARYYTEYDFNPQKMTFTMRTLNEELYAGTYEHASGSLTLHYNGITEKYTPTQDMTVDGYLLIHGDQTEKYQRLYPQYTIASVTCTRWLSMWKMPDGGFQE